MTRMFLIAIQMNRYQLARPQMNRNQIFQTETGNFQKKKDSFGKIKDDSGQKLIKPDESEQT